MSVALGLCGVALLAVIAAAVSTVPHDAARRHAVEGRLQDATDALDRAAWWLSPITLALQRAELALLRGEHDAAVAACRSALLRPVPPRMIRQGLTICARALDPAQDPSADAVLHELLHQHPADPAAHLLLAERALQASTVDAQTAQRLEACIDLSSRSFRDAADLPVLRAMLARVRLAEGSPAEARGVAADLDLHAIQGGVRRATVHRHLAMLAEALGEPDQARAHWQAIVDAVPELAIASEARKRPATGDAETDNEFDDEIEPLP